MIFHNADWTVDSDGMNSVKPLLSYDIDIEQVLDRTKRGDREFYDWPVHMAEKAWVDISLLNEAFDHAIRYYAKMRNEPIDEDMLESSYREALKLSRRYRYPPAQPLPLRSVTPT